MNVWICWIKYPKDDDKKFELLTGFKSAKKAMRYYVKQKKLKDYRTVICCMPITDDLWEEGIYTMNGRKKIIGDSNED